MIKGLAFDLDGTLIDTQRANYLAYKDSLLAIGLEITETEFASNTGLDSRVFLKNIYPNITDQDIAIVRKLKKKKYPLYFFECKLNIPLLDFILLNRNSKKIAAVTTGKIDNTYSILNYFNIMELFDVVITGDDVKNPKPDPEPYLLAIERLGMIADEILAFEDSEVGMKSATRAGISVLKVKIFHE